MDPLTRILPTDRLPHVWQVIATLLAVASLWTLCWWLSEQGMLDLAATGLAFYVVTLTKQIGGSLSSRAPKEFKATAGLVDTARADFAAWMANRKLLSHVLIALAVTILFLVGRFVASTVMAMIASPWLALAVGLAVAAAVASPVLVRGVIASMKSGTETKEPAHER